MLKSEIVVGETYYFVGSDSPTRKHLAGMPFKVVRKERVFRKQAYRRGKARTGTVKVLRFFNDDNIGARAEELEPLPEREWSKCSHCNDAHKYADLEYNDRGKLAKCPACGCLYIPDFEFSEIWREATEKPKKEGFYNVVTSSNRLIVSPYELEGWGYDREQAEICEGLPDMLDKVVRWRPSTYQPFKEPEYLDVETDGNKIGKALAGEDCRDWPCEQCEDGEMVQDGGTSPSGTTTYRCNSCGVTATFP